MAIRSQVDVGGFFFALLNPRLTEMAVQVYGENKREVGPIDSAQFVRESEWIVWVLYELIVDRAGS